MIIYCINLGICWFDIIVFNGIVYFVEVVDSDMLVDM